VVPLSPELSLPLALALLLLSLLAEMPRKASAAKDSTITNSRYMRVFIWSLQVPQDCWR